MPEYNVHVYAIVRVKVAGIEAESPIDAITQAQEVVDYDYFSYALSKVDDEAEYTGEDESYLVDVVGDEDYVLSRTYSITEYNAMMRGKTITVKGAN